MRRGLTVVAAGITAFAVVLLASVVYAYGAMASQHTSSPSQRAQVAEKISAEADIVTDTVVSEISARDAASLAGRYIQRSDPYSVELAERFGSTVYKVTFSSGDVVYVSRLGALLATVPPPADTYVVTWNGGGGGGGGGASSQFSDGEDHDEHDHEQDEHEEHEEEDHHESEAAE